MGDPSHLGKRGGLDAVRSHGLPRSTREVRDSRIAARTTTEIELEPRYRLVMSSVESSGVLIGRFPRFETPSGQPAKTEEPLSILMLATKPPWPLIDGSRLLVRNTLEGLARAGHRVTLVAPVDSRRFDVAEAERALADLCEPRLVSARPPSLAHSFVRSSWTRRPLSIQRHAHPAVEAEVERLLVERRFDVVHVEQLQALAQAEPAFARGLPVVLRAQNVESDLWTVTAEFHPFYRALARREGWRLAEWESLAIARTARTLALTERDAARLGEFGGPSGRVTVVRAPFPGSLPAAEGTLPGSPAIVLLGSEGWLPNRDAVAWFARTIWPVVQGKLPAAQLHVFGNRQWRPSGDRITWHPPPSDSRDAFVPGSIMAVPLRIASGVRMKILEAWARGIPVVALPQAAAGLEATHGRELLLARDATEFAAAFTRLAGHPGLSARLIQNGREALARRHSPENVTAELVAAYRAAVPAAASG